MILGTPSSARRCITPAVATLSSEIDATEREAQVSLGSLDRSGSGATTDISSLMRTHMFGPDPAHLPVHDTLAAATASASRHARAAVRILSQLPEDEAVASIKHEYLSELDRAASALRDIDRPVRVALMGRTMSGKSTLFEALTGGDGSRIGAGAQRTTRKSLERAITHLPGVTLVDTPGVGAMDGGDDRLRAFEAMLDCDLVLWVAANDSTQQETADALVTVALVGKPILVVLNCRQGIGSPAQRRRFLRHPDRPFDGLDGHIDRLSGFLTPHGVRPRAVVAVHALAAFHGFSQDDMSLLDASCLCSLVNALVNEIATVGPQRQALTVLDSIRGPVHEAAIDLQVLGQTMTDVSTRTSQSADEYLARLCRTLDEASAEGSLRLAALIDGNLQWHQYADLENDLKTQFRRQQEGVQAEFVVLLEQLDEEIRELMSEEERLFVEDWTLPEVEGANTPPFVDGRARGNRAARLAVRVAGGIVGGAVIVSNPGGWTVAAVAIGGFVLDRWMVKPAIKPGGWIDRVVPSRMEAVRRLRKQLAAENRSALERICHQAQEALTARSRDYAAVIERSHADLCRRAQHLADISSIATGATASLQEICGELDTEAARALLALAGRPRAAKHVAECVRQPGSAMAVGFREGVAVEEALFPSMTAEPVYPFDADASRNGARRVMHVVCAAYPPPYSAVMRDHKIVVVTPPSGWPGQAVTVERLASEISDLKVLLQHPDSRKEAAS